MKNTTTPSSRPASRAARITGLLSFMAGVGVFGGPTASAQINIDDFATYDLALDEAPVAFAELAIGTCDEVNAGTNSTVELTIVDKNGKTYSYHLDNPGDDAVDGAVDEHAFKFPRGLVSALKSFSIKILGDDAWCIDYVALNANRGNIVNYLASDPLKGDKMSPYASLSGKGNVWLSTDSNEGVSSMTFSDEKFLDPFTRVLTGYLGLPLRRSSTWTYVESINLNSSLRSRFNTCSPPTVLWPHELEQMITTKLGDMISRRGDIYWGNGYVNVTATKTGSAPIYHARAKFFAKAPLKDATVFVDLDITPSCNTTDGLQFAVSTPDIDVNLSLGTKFVRGIADIFTLGLAEIWIDTSPSAPKISSPATKTPICPVFSVGANDELKMKWPSSVELSALNIPAKSLPPLISPSTKVYLPLNPLCVDTSSIKLR